MPSLMNVEMISLFAVRHSSASRLATGGDAALASPLAPIERLVGFEKHTRNVFVPVIYLNFFFF